MGAKTSINQNAATGNTELNWERNNETIISLELSYTPSVNTIAGAEMGFAGMAVRSGVKSALASLWKVNDIGTLGLMTEFYRHLRSQPIKAEALRKA